MKRVAYAEFDITKLLGGVEFRGWVWGLVFRVAGSGFGLAVRRNKHSKQLSKWGSRYSMHAELHP